MDKLVADVIDHDEQQELADEHEKYIKSLVTVKAAAVPKAKANPLAKKKKFGHDDLLMLEMANSYLPEVAGCSITNETLWHTRYRVTYPTKYLPDNTSASYDEHDEGSRRSAMLFCVAWAWGQHEEASGEPCPWDLSG